MNHSFPSGPARLRAASIGLALSLGVAAVACGDDGGAAEADDASGPAYEDGRTGANPAVCVDEPAEGEDLFPDKFELTYAENLSLEYHDTYKVLTVAEPAPEQPARTYVLTQCGIEAPPLEGDLAGATVVEVPVRSLFSESTSHLGFIEELGAADVVAGVAWPDIVVSPVFREGLDGGEVVGFSSGGEVDAEVVVFESPDVYVTMGTEDPAHEVVAAGGVPVMANAEWLETTPLGWAEWIAFFAALTNTEGRAEESFAEVRERYEEVARLAEDVEDRPSVMTGSLLEGDWYTRGGGGTYARFIADAGGDFVYADTSETGTLVVDIEQMLVDGREADVWLSPSEPFGSRSEAAALDERYLEFGAWEAGGVWDDVDERDGVSRFEQGPLLVDVMLRDYLSILHPELVEGHEPVFFERVAD